MRPQTRLADVGTDHAHLPVALIEQGRVTSAVATDIIPGPVASANRTVTEAGLSDRIDVRLGDGLAPIGPDEADDIVIAGMGGENIAAILGAAPWVKNPRFRLILQPMTRPEVLRRFLAENGFAIEREVTTKDGIHHHVTMQAAYGGKPTVPDERFCYLGALDPVRDEAYLRHQYRRHVKRAQGLDRGGEDPAAAERVAAMIQSFLEGETP